MNHDDLAVASLSELWNELKWRACFAVPVHFTSEYHERREHGFYRVKRSWWQWRSKIFWQRDVDA